MRNKLLTIKVTEEELKKLHLQAKNAGMTLSRYLRSLGLGYPIESKIDQLALAELTKVAGDLGRLGGLFKLWLSNTKEEWDPRLGDKSRFKVELLVREIEHNKKELLDIARRLL
ncbi:MAG: DNA transfer protein [Sulfurovaceae bacterium]